MSGLLTVTPLLPIWVLLAGVALLVIFGLPLRFRATGPLAAAVAGAATLAMFALQGQLPVRLSLSDWRPVTLLPNPLSLYVDGLAWVFGLALLLLTTAALLTGLSRPGGHRAQLRAFMLLITAAALAALFSANLLTLTLAWTAFDVVFVIVMLFNLERSHAGEYTVFTVMLNGAATLLLWAVALLTQADGGSLYLHLAAFTPAQTTLLVLAAIVRLGLYPLHLWLPTEIELRPGLGALLHIVPATLGLSLLARLALVGGPALALHSPLTIAAAAALIVGALLAWGQDDHRHALSFVVLLQTGVTVLAGMWSGALAPLVLVAEGLVLILGTGLLFLARGHLARTPWATLPAAVAVLALLALPVTLGFVGRSALYAAWGAAGEWGLLALGVVTQALLAATLLRHALRPAGEDYPPRPALVAATLIGELLLAGPLLLLGAGVERLAGLLGLSVRPSLADVLGHAPAVVWAALALSLAGGVLVYRREQGLRALRRGARPWLTAILNLRWLYRLGRELFGAIAAAVRAVAGLLEGEGALLWTLVVLLLAWLAFRPLG